VSAELLLLVAAGAAGGFSDRDKFLRETRMRRIIGLVMIDV
jgi:hypothetical protein